MTASLPSGVRSMRNEDIYFGLLITSLGLFALKKRVGTRHDGKALKDFLNSLNDEPTLRT